MKFTHLHTHSHYSLLDGLAKIDDLVGRAKEEGMEALALTDHGVMYGAVEFYQKSLKAGIKPIIGVEFYLAPNGRHLKRARIDDRRYHVVLLAKDYTGYQNLIKLTSLAHLEGFYYKPRIDWESLQSHSQGLIALTACLSGELPVHIRNNNFNKAKEAAQKFIDIFGKENVYLELQHHPNYKEYEGVNRGLVELAGEMGLGLVATNDIHYIDKLDSEAQDVLVCLQTKKKLDDKDRMTMVGEDFSFRSAEQMIEDFKHLPEAISNTEKIASRCNLKLELGKIQLPYYDVPGVKSADEYLEGLCYQGVVKRRLNGEAGKQPDKKAVRGTLGEKAASRLDYELEIIKKTGYATYFLIVQDFVNWAKDSGIIVGPGRGSAAGSLVSYYLGITNIDPIKYELIFERFLNPERISMPDIDLDFADTRRDEVIDYVSSKYGSDHVAQIITFGTMAARAAIRDVGRVLDLPYNYCDRLAKLIPMFTSLEKALSTIEELKELYQNDPDAKRLIDIAKKLEGVSRHSSTHACGVVITKDPLTNYTPVQFASSGDESLVTQYDLHAIEDLGLLKMDFLGLKNLTILENTIEIVKAVKGIEVNIDKIPMEDSKTFNLLKKGETTGVFQLESSGMKRYLRELKPTNLEDIIAMVSLYRPGPMELIPDFIQGKHGKKTTTYLHPKLKPILEKTHGVAVYQEQVLEIAREIAGFSLGEADILRKAVGKKIPQLLKEQKKKFIQGCLDNGIVKPTAEKIFAFIEPFAGYGFNRAHAAAYAMIAYQTAYLKANYPNEFMASLLTSDEGDVERVAVLVEECNKMGIQVLAPEINESFKHFTVVKGSQEPRIRFGLKAIKNVGENVVETIIKERKKNGPYKNLEDFLSRVQTKDLNKKSLESLIKCGSLGKMGERNRLLANIEQLLSFIKNINKARINGQSSLFDSPKVVISTPQIRLEDVPEASQRERLSWEKELLGLYISEHPFRELQNILKEIIVPCNKLEDHFKKGQVVIGGVISSIKKIVTRTSENMLFVKVEDTTAGLEVLVFPTILKVNPMIWQEDKMVLVKGKLSDKDGEIKILCNQADEIDEQSCPEIAKKYIPSTNGQAPSAKVYAVQKNGIINLHVSEKIDANSLQALKGYLNTHPGFYKVFLTVKGGGKTKKIETDFYIDFNLKIKSDLELLTGNQAEAIQT